MLVPVDDPLARLHGRDAFFRVYESYWLAQSTHKLPHIPRPSKAIIDLYTLFLAVQSYGGIDKVYNAKLFQPVAARLRLPITATSCGNILNKLYRSAVLPCEEALVLATNQAYKSVGLLEEIEVDIKVEAPIGHKNKKVKKEPTAVKVAMEIPKGYLSLSQRIFSHLVRHSKINFGALPLDIKASNLLIKTTKHVVVIGGGVAGLGAARQLKSFGYDVTILEAKNRLGGRCYSAWKEFGAPVDLGAMLITGLRQNPLDVICKQLSIELSVLKPSCPLLDITGETIPALQDQQAENIFNSVLESVNKQRRKIEDNQMALGDLFHQVLETYQLNRKRERKGQELESQNRMNDVIEARLLRWHTANLEYGCGSGLDKVSLQHWDQDDPFAFDGDHMLVCSGYSKVIEGLADGMQECVRLNAEVQSIDYTQSDVTVKLKENEGQKENIKCDAVLVTASLGVLKDDWLRFNPPLPQWKTSAINSMGFGWLDKVILMFDSPFWDCGTDYFGILHSDDANRGGYFLFWNMTEAYKKPILLALVAGEATIGLESRSDKENMNNAMTVLRRTYKSAPDPIAYTTTRWGHD
eukprot:Ihof_evm4s38 gene=Ihof_evmTU4s38